MKQSENLKPYEQKERIEIDLEKSYQLNQIEYDLVVNNWAKGKERAIPDVSIVKLIEEQVLATPYKKAIISNKEELTYSEMNMRANQIAWYLSNLKLKKGSLIAIYLDRSVEMVVTIIGVMKAGFAYVPIDPSSPKERINQIISDSCPGLVITDKDCENLEFVEQTSVIRLIEIQDKLRTCSQSNLDLKYSTRDIAYVIYTSGSTGRPKGVQIEHRPLVNFVLSISHLYEITSKDTLINFASIAFDVSVFDIFTSLVKGCTLYIASEEERKSPAELTMAMNKFGVTVAELPPALLPLLDPEKLPILRLISVGGEMFSGTLVEKWSTANRRFFNGYGPTETTVAVTVYECKGKWAKNPPIGVPIDNVQAYILNKKLEPVPIDTPGELYIGGECLSKGYLNMNQLTEEKFVNNPFDRTQKIYNTGDIAKWLPDGNLEILGRSDKQVKIRGYRIELEEVEAALNMHLDIKQAVVETFLDNEGSQQLVGYLMPNNNFLSDPISIRKQLSSVLPSYMVPAHFITIPTIPLTPNGKLDRGKLPSVLEVAHEEIAVGISKSPTNEIEARICDEIFKKILPIKNIGVHDNFFDLGGNSLQATLVVSRIRETFDIEINLIDFFQSPTIASLYKFVKEKEESNKSKRDDLMRQINEIEEPWIKIHKAEKSKFRIVCFPYSGANGHIFKKWPEKLAPDFEVITFELPGHGTKIKEEPYDSATDVAQRLASEIEVLSDKPLVFVGHSGGAILAFETCRVLFEKGIRVHRLFTLASRAPHVDLKEEPRYFLPTEQFLARVNEYGGLSDEFLKNTDLLDIMVPVMRADEKLAETYKYEGRRDHFDFPITVYGGDQDRIDHNDLKEWSEINNIDFEFELFPGGHFFLKDCEDDVLVSIIESVASTPIKRRN